LVVLREKRRQAPWLDLIDCLQLADHSPMRIIDELSNGLARSLEQALRLKVTGYDQDEVGETARDAAALWERSLKASHPGWADSSLFAITQQLRSAGWQEGADAMDFVRTSANHDKHDAQPDHDIERIIESLRVLQAQLSPLQTHAPGAASELPPRLRIRHMVCAVYEMFHTGETLYSFLEATSTDTWQTAGSIDDFQVENKHSQAVEAQLAALPAWTVNPPELSDLSSSLKESDDELWFIASFDATYQQVHDIMASYQHGLPILRGLHREDSYGNFVASVAQAVLTGGAPVLAGRNTADLEDVQKKLDSLIRRTPDRLKPLRLDRCNAATYQNAVRAAIAVDRDIRALVTNRGVLLVQAD
jgi:hypothetical protein